MHTGTLPETAEILIVGGGMAGLQLAFELNRNGADDVVVLEAGPDSGASHINAANSPEDALRLWLEPGADDHYWKPWRSESVPHFHTMAGLRRRMGGRSLYWHGVILPIEPWALAEPWWPQDVVQDLTSSWRDGPGLYQRLQADLDEWRGRQEPVTPAITIGDAKLAAVPQAIRKLPDGRFAAYSPTEACAGRPGVRLIPNAEVLSTEMRGSVVRGVRVATPGERQPQTIRAETVVLAASTIENSRLAIQALYPAGLLDAPALDGLVDHIVQGFVAAIPAERLPANLSDVPGPDAFFYTPCAQQTRANLFVRLYRNSAGTVILDAWTMGEQLPGPHGVVTCTPGSDPRWDVTIRAACSPADRELIAAQQHELREFWMAVTRDLGMAPTELAFPDFDHTTRTLEDVMPLVDGLPPGAPALAWAGPLGSEYHESSTLPLGRRLTDRQEIMGLSGLYVAGPAVYPRPGAANPTLTNLALARRLAAVLAP
jgi:choline dehydrogenase-like flavoprotein